MRLVTRAVVLALLAPCLLSEFHTHRATPAAWAAPRPVCVYVCMCVCARIFVLTGDGCSSCFRRVAVWPNLAGEHVTCCIMHASAARASRVLRPRERQMQGGGSAML